MNNYDICINRQGGVALVLSLILLGSLTMIATASLSAGVMSMRVANNVEEDVSAFQLAQSALDAVAANPANLLTTGPLDTLNAVTLSGDPFNLNTGAGERLAAGAERTMDCGLPPRLSNGTSMLAYSAFGYRIHADLDRTTTGRGRSFQRLGQLQIGPKC